MRFTIGNKIFSAFGVLFAVFLIFGIQMYQKAEEMRKASHERVELSTMKTTLNQMVILHYSRLMELDEAIHTKSLPTFPIAYEECEFTKWRAAYPVNDPHTKNELEKLDSVHKQLHIVFGQIVALMKQNQYDKATELYESAVKKNLHEMIAIYQPMFNEIDQHHRALVEKRDTNLDEMKTLLIIGLLVTLGLIAIFYLWLRRSIITPASQMTQIANEISKGNVQQEIRFSANDEIGDFANAFRGMIVYMQEFSAVAHRIGEGDLNVSITPRSENDVLGKALNNMLITLNEIMTQLKEGTFALNSATSEILATASQVSSGASQTYSALTQTSASIEEIKQTAKVSSAKAVQTAESTVKVMEIAQNGSDGLDENMKGLNQIKEKMDLIASNIIQLNDQSQMISEIITTVEDIANQSNMLAVNASIEAVKAGEQGKGFSVVAGELKNLAEQSKQGTKQVQKILFDIQKVTGTLVMVAEQGGKAVESGVAQALKAKSSMEQLNSSVLNAANSGRQIAASYEQELSGMDQISNAMSSVKEATSQNLSSIKQVEMSAKDLSTLSQKIKAIMDHYMIDESK